MSFILKNLSPLGANARRNGVPSHFTYRTTDSLLTCGTSGYFNDVYTMLDVGDVIKVEVVDSVTTPTVVTDYGTLIVQSNASKVVDTYESQEGWMALTVDMTDVSTAATVYVPSPIAGTIQKIYSIINGAIATADAVLTAKIGSTAITGGVVTIANSGSAAGDVDVATPTALNVLAVGDNLNIATNGASTNTVRATIVFLVKPAFVDAA